MIFLPNDLPIIFIGFISAFVGSISGGAGLIAVPALLFLGVPPHISLGTSNFGDIGFKLGNIIKFSQYKNLGVRWSDVLVLTLLAVPATILGAKIVVSIDPTRLSKLIGIVLLILIPLIFVNKELGIKENRAKGYRLFWSHIAFFITRVWVGFFSPGSGFLETYVKMKGYGYTILQGKAVTRLAHILAGIGGVVVFALSGFINYRLSIMMFIGMLLGGYLGTAYAIKKGDVWLKPLLGVIIIVTAVKMIFLPS